MESNAGNATAEPLNFTTAYWVAEICIACFATASNLIVLIAFCTNAKLRTIPNWYIASLSVSDLLMGTFGIPFILIALTGHPKNNYGLCVSAVTAIVWIEVCSCFTLFALSFDRYYAVCRPLEYTTKMTQRRALFHIMLAWLTPLIYSMLIPLIWNSGPDDECYFIVVVNLYSLMIAYLGFFLPMFSIECFMYYKIFQAIRNQLKRLSHMQQVGVRLHLTSVNDSTNDVHFATPSSGKTRKFVDAESRQSNQTSKHIYPIQSYVSENIGVLDTKIKTATFSNKDDVRNSNVELDTSKEKGDHMCNMNATGGEVNVFEDKSSYLHRSNSCPILHSKTSPLASNSSADDSDINDNQTASGEMNFLITRTRENKPETLSDISSGGKSISSNKICDSNSIVREDSLRKKQVVCEKNKKENNNKVLASGIVNHIQSGRYRQERKTAILFVFILLFFFVSWSPVYIVDICLVYKIDVNQGLVNFAVLLSHFNSAFNPIFYAYKKEFRNVLKSWRRSLQRSFSSKCTKAQQNQIHPSSNWLGSK